MRKCGTNIKLPFVYCLPTEEKIGKNLVKFFVHQTKFVKELTKKETNRKFWNNGIDDTPNNGDEIEHVPRIAEVILLKFPFHER